MEESRVAEKSTQRPDDAFPRRPSLGVLNSCEFGSETSLSRENKRPNEISPWKLVAKRGKLNSFSFKTRCAFVLMFLCSGGSTLCNIKVIWPVGALGRITPSTCNVHACILLSFYTRFKKTHRTVHDGESCRDIFAVKNRVTNLRSRERVSSSIVLW